jgi:Domain of unknown function (DUF5615)
VAQGFPLLADNHVQQAVVEGLLTEGWDVKRAIDVFPEGTSDEVLFGHAVKAVRVFVTNDEDLLAIGNRWLENGRLFPGLVYWHEQDYAAMTTGDILRAFAGLAAKEKPFAYPIRFFTPSARTERRERFKRSRPRKR